MLKAYHIPKLVLVKRKVMVEFEKEYLSLEPYSFLCYLLNQWKAPGTLVVGVFYGSGICRCYLRLLTGLCQILVKTTSMMIKLSQILQILETFLDSKHEFESIE
jgi:hypothetical protein